MLSKYRRPPIRPAGENTHFELRCNCFEELSGQLMSHTHTHSPPAHTRHHSHSETRAGAGLTADHAAVRRLSHGCDPAPTRRSPHANQTETTHTPPCERRFSEAFYLLYYLVRVRELWERTTRIRAAGYPARGRVIIIAPALSHF